MQKRMSKMNKVSTFVTRISAAAIVAALMAPAMLLRADMKPSAKALTEDQKALHVLNRLGFGARPGDVEKVRAIGVQKYIDQQLNPISIPDSLAENKVRGFDITKMTTSEIFAKYPNPGALLRQIEGGRVAQAQPGAENAAAPQDDTESTT
jgi:hypothetical protein